MKLILGSVGVEREFEPVQFRFEVPDGATSEEIQSRADQIGKTLAHTRWRVITENTSFPINIPFFKWESPL